MWEFIVSGYIPGTSIQVTFETWLYAMAILAGLSVSVVVIGKLAKRITVAWRSRHQPPVLVVSSN